MAEKHTLPIDETPTSYSDWPTLIERAVDDVSRILRSEAQMFQTSMGAALELQISNTVAHLTIIAVMICGALCILCAAILLLHQWLPWWQAFGIAGLATLVVGIVSNAVMKPPTEIKT
jgi:VIT1/CCC1 family predicted Fe2+/Mn2+ transporter